MRTEPQIHFTQFYFSSQSLFADHVDFITALCSYSHVKRKFSQHSMRSSGKRKKKQNTEITRLGSSKVVVIKLTWLTDHQDCWSGAFRYTLVQFHNRSRSGCSTKLNPRSDHEMLREKPTNPKATSEVYKPQLTC